ncbi:MAG: PTS sugar transporter subunit IIA [Polyangiaceae bacterium]
MILTELLTPDRVHVHAETEGPLDKPQAIARLAKMLASESASEETVAHVLNEREQLQSTGIGEGVAIPHASLARLTQQSAALLVVPGGVAFDAIDAGDVRLLFAILAPKSATGEHLKTLARVSRLLRSKAFREELISSPDGRAAFDLIAQEERGPA